MSKSYEIDTIAAIATAPGEGGLAVVRVSGPRAISIADNLFDGSRLKPSERKGPSLVYGRVTDTMEVIDECILLIMPAPKSYTTEDVVEFQCHGGSVSSKKILRSILAQGARLAEPGEFTKRAIRK